MEMTNTAFGAAMVAADGQQTEAADAMALVALVHTKVEQVLYELMMLETRKAGTNSGAFSISRLMIYSGIHNHSKVRRGRAGLLEKMSIERQQNCWESDRKEVIYTVYSPLEVLARRQAVGLRPFASELNENRKEIVEAGRLTERLIDIRKLSPREAQVALKCSEGLTNADIGRKLMIHEETVKFHLRNIFIKFGVKRRTELMALLFQQDGVSG